MSQTLSLQIKQKLAEQSLQLDSLTQPEIARAAVAQAIHELGIKPNQQDYSNLVLSMTDDLLGLGIIETLLRKPGVTDVMVNGPQDIWVEENGQMIKTDLTFSSSEALLSAIRRSISPHGHRLDTVKPYVDARLPDGSRLHAAISPIAPQGPVLTLRRFSPTQFVIQDLISNGAVPIEAATILVEAVKTRQAMVVCGRTGVGKTTLLQVLLGQVAPRERVILIEDSPEITVEIPHIVRMETRTQSTEGVGEISIGNLVRQSLRMRPDRIVVGEVRGAEIADVLQALITGHEGCMTTIHAASVDQALVRLEGMALQSGLPISAARSQLSSALDLIIVLSRGPNNKRGVVQIAQMQGDANGLAANILWERQSWEN